MAHIVGIIGNKGGTGKTTLSHMVAQGMGLLGKRSVCVLTDISREKLSKEGRRYLPFDARSPENLQKVVKTLMTASDWFGVIDGGGNRPATDRMLAAHSDLILLPFRDSHEDIRTVISDLERFPTAYALPSQWPTNQWAKDAAQRNIEMLMKRFDDRILNPVYSISSSKLLLQSALPMKLPTPLLQICTHLALQVFDLWNIPCPKSDAIVQQTVEEKKVYNAY